MDTVEKYFPTLTPIQKEQFAQIGSLYPEWNEKINVISRKDIGNLYINHILHSLAIAKFLHPVAGTSFVDVGTGGGFPGIPLAILYPDCSFHLVDRVNKKLNVVRDIVEKIGLRNVTVQHGDLGECHEKFDFAISRAAMAMPMLVKITRRNIARRKTGNAYSNGIIALKGGELDEELRGLGTGYVEEHLSVWFSEPFFETKKLIYIPL